MDDKSELINIDKNFNSIIEIIESYFYNFSSKHSQKNFYSVITNTKMYYKTTNFQTYFYRTFFKINVINVENDLFCRNR